MRLNPAGTLSVDLQSCNDYEDGIERAKEINCPTLCVFSKNDRMTPLKGGMALAEALAKHPLYFDQLFINLSCQLPLVM